MNVIFQIKPKMLKSEAIDRLNSVVDDLPKYKKDFADLIDNFTIDKTLKMLNVIDRDQEFKKSKYYHLYNTYFDEIEDMIFIIDQ
jgi:hypothetical protein